MRLFAAPSGGRRMMAGALPTRTFLVECYSPGVQAEQVREAADRAWLAAAESRREGRAVQYLDAMLMAGDDVVFHVFAGPDEDAVREAAVRARLPFERVVESLTVMTGGPAPAESAVDRPSGSGPGAPR